MPGDSTTARTGTRQSGTSTPASMAWAIEVGIAATNRPSHGMAAVSRSRAPTTTKAPTATGHPPVGAPVVASSAAPGVDQATVTGMRWRTEIRIDDRPISTQSAASPDAAWADEAPTPWRPASTTANADV